MGGRAASGIGVTRRCAGGGCAGGVGPCAGGGCAGGVGGKGIGIGTWSGGGIWGVWGARWGGGEVWGAWPTQVGGGCFHGRSAGGAGHFAPQDSSSVATTVCAFARGAASWAMRNFEDAIRASHCPLILGTASSAASALSCVTYISHSTSIISHVTFYSIEGFGLRVYIGFKVLGFKIFLASIISQVTLQYRVLG